LLWYKLTSSFSLGSHVDMALERPRCNRDTGVLSPFEPIGMKQGRKSRFTSERQVVPDPAKLATVRCKLGAQFRMGVLFWAITRVK